VIPHFAHAVAADCPGAYESALHLAAKQLIADERVLWLPALAARAQGTDARGKEHNLTKPLRDKGLRQLDSVELEKYLVTVRPDCFVSCADHGQVMVEIKVTHAVDADKRAKVRELGIPLLEYNLFGLPEPTFVAIREVLFEESQAGTWLYHPEQLAEEELLQEELQQLFAAIKATVGREQAAAQEKERLQAEAGQIRAEADYKAWLAMQAEDSAERQKAAAKKSSAAKARAHALAQGGERASRFKALPEKEKVYNLCLWLGTCELPTALHVRVPWQNVIGAPPLLWQVALLGGIVLRLRQDDEPAPSNVTVEWATKWLQLRFNFLRESNEQVQSGRQMRSKAETAVWKYLWGLVKLGVLNAYKDEAFRIRVVGFDAWRSLARFRAAEIGPDRGLTWTPVGAWPDRKLALLIADAHAQTNSRGANWDRLPTLLPSARLRSPDFIASQYGDVVTVLEYLISAGFLGDRGEALSDTTSDRLTLHAANPAGVTTTNQRLA
jgi:hypothetical protein